MNVSTIKRQEKRIDGVGDFNLELGCGEKSHWRNEDNKEFVRIDCIDYGQDIVWDMENGIPLPDNSCKYIFSSHVMEHLQDFIGVMNECWRVLKKDGELYIIVPHIEHEKAYVPSHVRFFNKWTFDFFEYPAYADEYGSRLWEVKELIVNNRKDIHVKMKPKK